MLRILIPILVGALVVVVLLVGKRGGLIRGVVDDTLVSPARPAVAVSPRADLKLVDARRAELSPTVQGSTLPATSVQLCYALYQRPLPILPPTVLPPTALPSTALPSSAGVPEETAKAGASAPSEARLVALLAVAEAPYRWPVQADTDTHRDVMRTLKQELAGYSGSAETFVLSDADDPWSAVEDKANDLWRAGSLVRRYTFMLWQHRAKLLIEYREPLPRPGILPLADDIPALAAFEQRALAAFAIQNGDTGVERLPRPERNLPYPPETVNRRMLTAYLGELWDHRQ